MRSSSWEVYVSRLQADKARAARLAARLDVKSAPFPGISTDWGPLVQVLLSQANAEFTVTETVILHERLRSVGADVSDYISEQS